MNEKEIFMKRTFACSMFAAAIVALFSTATAFAAGEPSDKPAESQPAAQAPQKAELEKKFSESLSGATFDAIWDQKVRPELVRREADRQRAVMMFALALIGGALLAWAEYLFAPGLIRNRIGGVDFRPGLRGPWLRTTPRWPRSGSPMPCSRREDGRSPVAPHRGTGPDRTR